MINDTDIALVERYLEGRLVGDELKAFKQREADDPDFAHYIKVQELVEYTWTSAAEYSEVKQWVADSISHHKESKTRFGKRTIWLSLAAVILILFGVYAILKLGNQDANDQPAFASDTSNVELLIQQTGQPDQKAGIDTVFTYPILSGMINNEVSRSTDSLYFSWESNIDHKELFIALAGNDSIVLRTILENGQSSLILNPGSLKSGVYYWGLDNFNVKGHFSILDK